MVLPSSTLISTTTSSYTTSNLFPLISLLPLYLHRDGNETDNEVFRSGSESPQYKVEVESKQRRATVSGGSPTHTRPPLVIEDLDQKESSPVVSPDDYTSEELKDSEATKDEKRDTEGGTFVVKRKSGPLNYFIMNSLFFSIIFTFFFSFFFFWSLLSCVNSHCLNFKLPPCLL